MVNDFWIYLEKEFSDTYIISFFYNYKENSLTKARWGPEIEYCSVQDIIKKHDNAKNRNGMMIEVKRYKEIKKLRMMKLID